MLPLSAPETENEDKSEDKMTLPVFIPSSHEPVKFRTIFNLPTAQPSAEQPLPSLDLPAHSSLKRIDQGAVDLEPLVAEE